MAGCRGSRPEVGILSDMAQQRHRLESAAERLGLRVAFCGEPELLLRQPAVPDTDLWLLILADEADHPQLFEHLLAHTDAPVLFGMDPAPRPGSADYLRWQRRLREKLEQQLGPLREPGQDDGHPETDTGTRPATPTPELPHWVKPAAPGTPASEVWVLAASLGGPAAVKAFLDHLPAGLPVAFLYAQHIDRNFTDVLTRVLGRHSHYNLRPAQEGYRPCHGDVVLIPVEREWKLDETGALTELDRPWPGPYGPSIDQVLLNIADFFGKRCHAIIFSGMGNDGAIAAPILRAYGSRIWVQESSSCSNSSMPEAVAATGCTSFCGTPEELARELVKTIEESCLLKSRQQRDSA